MSIRKNGSRILATKGNFKGCIGTVRDVKGSAFTVDWNSPTQYGWSRYGNLNELNHETGARLVYPWEQIHTQP
jgi:hypothetical protein